MIPISEANFIVMDVETTGASPTECRITDISCIFIKNLEIIGSFSSLINPHQHIPWYIQRMTGITNKMVMTAPDANIVMPKIKELFLQKNACFVAHNSQFDWNFVYETLLREKLFVDKISNIEIPNICTLKIARKIMPQTIKKNVGSLAAYFDIPIQNRHRAYDDAFATANFFIEMLLILQDHYEITTVEEIIEFQNKKQTRISKINNKSKIKIQKYQKHIPKQSGIILFIGSNREVIYISRAKNLSEHLNNFVNQIEVKSKKMTSVLRKFEKIEWILTNSELETNVLENRKIKFFEPKYNKFYDRYNDDKYNNDRYNNFVETKVDLFNTDKFDAINQANKQLVESLNFIAFLPNSKREKTIDLYFICNGKFENMFTIGTKSNMSNIFDKIHDVYYIEKPEWESELIDIDEVRIIKNWLKKYERILKLEYQDDLDELIFGENVENTVRNFYDEKVDDSEFYIGTFIYE